MTSSTDRPVGDRGRRRLRTRLPDQGSGLAASRGPRPTPTRNGRRTTSRLRVLVLGYIVRGPLGGLAWHHLQYVMGLARLGHDVYFIEDSDDYPSCYDPARDITSTDPTYGLEFARQTFREVGLGDRWAYYDAHTSHWLGPCAARALNLCASADLLLNVSGVNPTRPWLTQAPTRVLVDTDPAFTQIRHITDPCARKQALQHTAFFSFAENIGRTGCTIPGDGLPWRATRQPIVLDAWPVTSEPARGKFTTIMQWDSYRAREYAGQLYGMKSDSFAPYLDLPERVGPIFELALGSSTAPRAVLRSKGWRIRDPRVPTRTAAGYQRYIQQSKAEFSVAKHGYVVSHSGWFSERSAAYLASGRPVVVQDTGFTTTLPVGLGVLAFSDPDQALARIGDVQNSYTKHATAAREVAGEYFDSGRVLTRLIEQALSTADRPLESIDGGLPQGVGQVGRHAPE